MSVVIVSVESPEWVFDEHTFHATDTRRCALRVLETESLLPGKVPPEILLSEVFSRLGSSDPDLILGPGLGQDASLIRFGDKILVASTDPITGSVEDVGWLSVHVNANDVATFGVAPKWFLNSIILPSGSTKEELGRIMQQINDASKSLGIAVVGGHTEITDDIDKPIIAGFMLGETTEGEYVTSTGANPGDALILTKSAAIEGTAILASEGRKRLTNILGDEITETGITLRNKISVVKEGIVAFQTGHITAMHDPTEGGIAGGIHELCDASDVGCIVDSTRIPVHPSTIAICQLLDIDYMNLISSGCMLMTCKEKYAEDVVSRIEAEAIQVSIIGEIAEEKNLREIKDNGATKTLERPKTDALWLALEKLSTL